MTACHSIETIVGGFDLNWKGTPMLTVTQKYNVDRFDHVSVSFTSPRTIHIDASFIGIVKKLHK